MSRKPKKGYYVRGQFVAEGSELDLQFKAELKGTDQASRTELKRESEALQRLGEDLLHLRADLMQRLALPEKLQDALQEAKRITNFEGKRRQMQFIGKLMRKLDEDALEAVRQALEEQRQGSAAQTQALHVAEHWRERFLQEDQAVQAWLEEFPNTDVQQLRSLIRQVRKDNAAQSQHEANVARSQGLAPRQSAAWRKLFQFIKQHIHPAHDDSNAQEDADDADPADDDR